MNKLFSKIILALNVLIIGVIFVLNYFYQSNGFDFTLKCICSSGFALLGVINLIYALITKQQGKPFYIGMTLGLILAMLGDVLIGYDFIVGAAVFALGHVFFLIAYCFFQKFALRDFIISAVLFLAALAFLLFCPLLSFEVPVFKIVCIVYALIISTMLGKAIGNLTLRKELCAITLAVGSLLFFFSDLMLVFDWFIGLWDWTNEACMGTYYPALCILACSMYLRASRTKKD
ncbi:MAG: lysoplasmalogenase [Clostridia bacterium]|nr:lysoplasmalogenase [Clostridia bacterium]